MKNIVKQLSACVVCLLVASPVLATNGYFANGYGTKNKGLVGAGVALPQDAMIAATNPAGMVFVGERMDVGAAIFSPSPRSYDAVGGTGLADTNACGGPCPFELGPGNFAGQSIESENDYFLIPHFGYNWMLDSDTSAGVTVYGNGGMNTEYKGGFALHDNGAGVATVTPGTYGAGTAGVNLEQLFINVSVAKKSSATASVGASLIAVYQTFEAKGLGTFAPFSSNPAKLTNNGKDSATGFGFKVGAQGEIHPGVVLAGSYQSKMSMTKFEDYSGLFAEQGDFDIPSSWTVGLAWNTSPRSTLVFDIQTIFYSEVKSVGNHVSPLLTGQCNPGVGPGFSGVGPGCLGQTAGAGFGWDDMTIYKLGYQWTSGTNNNWIWRAGYSYGEQPIPTSEMEFNILAPAVIERHLSFGFTNTLSSNSEWNFVVTHAFEKSVEGPNQFTGGAQTIELEMSQWDVEASYAKKF
ncbi:OmpP1/FadL family transporter [Kaarinaea lacus]